MTKALLASGCFALGLLLLLAMPVAQASPSFDLYISSAGVMDLAVGQKLTLRALHPPPTCLPPPYTGARKRPAPAAEMPVVWSVEPADLASIDQTGTLTALKPGQVIVHVACRDEKAEECRLTSPGRKYLNLYAELSSERLPRLEGAPRIEDFRLQWDATPFQSRHELTVSITGEAFAWSAGLGTPQTPATPLPWVLDAAPDRSWFDDEEGNDDNSDRRKRAYVTSARLTIAGWKDGIASGRLQLRTTRGVTLDTTFKVRIQDRDGVLGQAARSPGSGSK